MKSIASEGWDGLLAKVGAAAQERAPDATDFLHTLFTMDGRVPLDLGVAALPREARDLLRLVEALDCEVDTSAIAGRTTESVGVPVGITTRGRLCVIDLPADAIWAGTLRGRTSEASRSLACALAQYDADRRDADAQRKRLRAELATWERGEVKAWITRIESVLLHMAPLQVYVGDVTFSNLGKGNLPGRSVAVGAPENLLNRLRDAPVANWSPEETTFVAVCWILLASGPQSRLEEANGLSLDLAWLAEMLTSRACNYGLNVDVRSETQLGVLLDAAALIGARRVALLAEGAVFYREIHGVNLNKEEKLFAAAPGVETLHRLGHRWAEWEVLPATTAQMGREIADRVRDTDQRQQQASHAEALRAMLHDIVEASGSDVAMARGPRELFFVDDLNERDPLELRTSDFYCCVVPSQAFAAQHTGQSPALSTILSAYSSRMRFNSWHYLPHVVDLTESTRDDWFFAPTMPDFTHGSEWHHTGHVKFGVRYAIRVPIQVTLAGRELPGLYDLRLMRSTGAPFTANDLEAAVAFAQVLRTFHEETYNLSPAAAITEFDNAWFRSTYAG